MADVAFILTKSFALKIAEQLSDDPPPLVPVAHLVGVATRLEQHSSASFLSLGDLPT